jgi:hypothetical protein
MDGAEKALSRQKKLYGSVEIFTSDLKLGNLPFGHSEVSSRCESPDHVLKVGSTLR